MVHHRFAAHPHGARPRYRRSTASGRSGTDATNFTSLEAPDIQIGQRHSSGEHHTPFDNLATKLQKLPEPLLVSIDVARVNFSSSSERHAFSWSGDPGSLQAAAAGRARVSPSNGDGSPHSNASGNRSRTDASDGGVLPSARPAGLIFRCDRLWSAPYRESSSRGTSADRRQAERTGTNGSGASLGRSASASA
jgi:hypothetical protein